MPKIAIYPGTFTPFHKGHYQIITRAARLFDQVIVIVSHNPAKKTDSQTLINSATYVKEKCKSTPNVIVDINLDGLTIDKAQKWKASYIVKGIRNKTDFKHEQAMFFVNHKYNKKLETVFFMAYKEDAILSSTLVKEIKKYQVINKK